MKLFSLDLLDARVKMALLLLISTLSVASRSITRIAVLLAFTILFLILGGVNVRGAIQRLRMALKLVLSLFLLQIVFNRSGERLLSIGSFTLITWGGVETAVLVTLRLLAVLLSAVIVMSGDTRDYLLGLTQWHVPYEIAFMILAGLKFLPALREEAQDVMCAVQMRGVDLHHLPIREKFSTYLSVMTPIVARTIHRSEQMSIAMEARAFRAYGRRTSMRRIIMNKSDWQVLIASATMLALIAIGV